MVSLNRNTKEYISIQTSNQVSLLKKLQQLVCQMETLMLAISTRALLVQGQNQKVGQLESSATKPFLSHSSTNIHFSMFF